jgi:hypothetical protein
VNLNKAAQAALVLSVPASITYGNTGLASTTGGSGTGAVTFSDTGSTGCSVNASTGVISVSNASNTCSISASKAGDDNYTGPVTDGPKSVNLNKADQTITFAALPNKTWGDAAFTVAATASSGLAVTFASSTGSVCTVSGSTVTLVYVGTCTIKASQVGNDNYKAAPDVSRSLQVFYRWDGFLQPINDTAHQIGTLLSQFKLGSTVPAKFQLKQTGGTVVQSSATPTFSVSGNLGSCGAQVSAESVATDPATSGSTYRWDSTAQQYVFNWSTKSLKAGKYRIFANLDDGNTNAYYVDICLQ